MDDAGKPMDSNPANVSSVGKFVSPGILLFIDQLIVAAGGWAYWLVISKFVSTSEIGHATTIYSLVLLVNTIIQLGLEYPLLKKSTIHRSRIFGTAIVIELAITAISIPFVLYAANNLYQESQQLAWLAVGILVFSSVTFIARFALLGLSDARSILIFDVIGLAVKFSAGFTLVSAGYGALGILLSFLLQAVAVTAGILYASKGSFGFGFGNIEFAMEIIKDSLVNMPSKLSGMLIISLSVVLLASFNIDSSEIGIFYIAMMISIVAGSFASSMAFMSIPASSATNTDLSLGGLRISLCFTAPIIAVLMSAPEAILSVIGTEYVAANELLVILAAGILPAAILSNAMSRFNNRNEPKKLLIIGIVRIGVFVAAFFILVPNHGTLGAAYSMLMSFVISAAISLMWMGKTSLRYIAISIASVTAGVIVGQQLTILIVLHPIVTIAFSLITAFIVIFTLKGTSIREIAAVVKIRKNNQVHKL